MSNATRTTTSSPAGERRRGESPKRAALRSRNGNAVTVTRKGSAAGDGRRGESPKTGEVVRKGKNWTAKRGPGAATGARPYPVQACSTRWKDPETGKFVSRPKDEPAPGRARKGRAAGAVTIRTVTEHGDGEREVTGVRTVLGAFRRGQERGQLRKSYVREVERETSRERLAELNPRLAADLENEAMREGHRSDKAKRGAATRAKNKAAGIGKKKRTADQIRTDLLKTEAALKDAQRRHAVARTTQARDKYRQTIRTRTARLAKLRRELAQAAA